MQYGINDLSPNLSKLSFMWWTRLFKRTNTPTPITCPRCLGKGHVDEEDIIRLNRQGKWRPGVCAYCSGSGKVSNEVLSRVPVDARHLTTNLPESVRDAIINDPKRDDCPVSERSRLWLENAFLSLLSFFGKENTQQRRVLTPHHSDFPIQYSGTEESAHDTMKIVATQMEVPCDSIQLCFYDDQVREVSTGSPFGGKIYLESRKEDQIASGVYLGQAENRKYELWLNRKNLSEPENLVATLAHEIGHIKLLGENRIKENDEQLTDLTMVIFGLGIFGANAAFKTTQTLESYSWSSHGYLSQMEWGYALALFAHLRREQSPKWINHLTPNVKSDFLLGQQFILANPDTIFKEP